MTLTEAKRGGHQSPLLPPASLARLLVLPGSDEARMTTAGSGRQLCAQYLPSGPLGQCLKTLLESTAWTSSAVYLTWTARHLKRYRRATHLPLMRSSAKSRRSVTKSSRLLFLLQPSRLRTSGCESLLWPTPDCSRRGSRSNDLIVNNSTVRRRGSGQLRGIDLETAVSLWPTPRGPKRGADLGKLERENRTRASDLETAVRLFPTPIATESRQGYQDRTRGKKGRQESLTTIVRKLLPTPTVQDSKNNGGPSQHNRNTPPLNALFGALNPEWEEWLMGFPLGWTEVSNGSPSRISQESPLESQTGSLASGL